MLHLKNTTIIKFLPFSPIILLGHTRKLIQIVASFLCAIQIALFLSVQMNCDGRHSVILVEVLVCFYPVASADFQCHTIGERNSGSVRGQSTVTTTVHSQMLYTVGQHH